MGTELFREPNPTPHRGAFFSSFHLFRSLQRSRVRKYYTVKYCRREQIRHRLNLKFYSSFQYISASVNSFGTFGIFRVLFFLDTRPPVCSTTVHCIVALFARTENLVSFLRYSNNHRTDGDESSGRVDVF